LSSQGNRQGGNVSQHNELAHTQKGKALKEHQPEVTFDPGEMALDIRS